MTAPGPYIVTVKPKHTQACEDAAFVYHAATGGGIDCECNAGNGSRVAVATLDEAHIAVYRISQARDIAQAPQGRARPWLSLHDVVRELPEEGGTIILPDGTVIEVSRADA